MAGSLEIAVQLPPNPTNIITNASGNTGSGVGSSDSACIAVANANTAANVEHKRADNGLD
eukprot:scaffold80498_cov21-Cyclotella_meneghiniana.AAC.1